MYLDEFQYIGSLMHIYLILYYLKYFKLVNGGKKLQSLNLVNLLINNWL
jgi:hypothetical protein